MRVRPRRKSATTRWNSASRASRRRPRHPQGCARAGSGSTRAVGRGRSPFRTASYRLVGFRRGQRYCRRRPFEIRYFGIVIHGQHPKDVAVDVARRLAHEQRPVRLDISQIVGPNIVGPPGPARRQVRRRLVALLVRRPGVVLSMRTYQTLRRALFVAASNICHDLDGLGHLQPRPHQTVGKKVSSGICGFTRRRRPQQSR